jgi:hypothetical protein
VVTVEKRSTRGGRRACLSLQAPSLSRRTSPRSKAAMRSSVVALAGSGAGGSRSTREQLRCDGEAVYMRAVRCHWWPHPPPLAPQQQRQESWRLVPAATCMVGDGGGRVWVAVWLARWPQQLPLAPLLSPLL